MAAAGANGIPRDSIGIRLEAAAPLLADSGPATPSMAPWPHSSLCLLTECSTLYEKNVDVMGDGPGISPIKRPITDPRSIAGRDLFHSTLFGNSSLNLTFVICGRPPACSATERTSAAPYSPMTTGTVSCPRASWLSQSESAM